MKKIIILFFLLLFFQIAKASDIGYVDYNVMYKNIPLSKELQAKIDAKATEINQYNNETLSLVKKQDTSEGRTEVVLQRKPGLEKLEREYKELKQKQTIIVKSKVKAASKEILDQKKLDIIIDKKNRVVGGVDCTQDILRVIK